MRLAGNGGKGRWQGNNLHALVYQVAEQFGKTQIVADGQAEFAKRGINDTGFRAWLNG